MFIISGTFAVMSGIIVLVGKSSMPMVILSSIFGGLTVSGVYANLWGCMPNAADYGEWKTGVKSTGLIYGLATFAIKVAVAITSYLSGWMLSLADYDATLTQQTPQTINKIYMCYGIFPVIVGILAIIFILPYNLDRKTMHNVETALHGSQNQH